MPCGVDAVVDIGPPPLAPQHVAVLAPVTGRAAVVDVDQREAPARPVLVLEVVDGKHGARRSPMTVHDKRRFLTGLTFKVRVPRRGVKGVPGYPALGRGLDWLWGAGVERIDV